MSVSKWAYEPEKCDGDFCPGDCDGCFKKDETKGNEQMSNRLETLKSELEQIRNLKTLAYDLKYKVIEYYENEIRAIEEYNAGI